jgi:ribosome biogenesis GTPase A
VDYGTLALFGARFLMDRYPKLLLARYKLDALPDSPEALLEAIARRRGKLRAGGAVDVEKAAELLVHEFRTGVIGRISLEAPK